MRIAGNKVAFCLGCAVGALGCAVIFIVLFAGDRPNEGGEALAVTPIKIVGGQDVNNHRQQADDWLADHNVFFSSMPREAKGTCWGLVIFVLKTNVDASLLSTDIHCAISEGDTQYPIMVRSEMSSTSPIVVPLDSMSIVNWSKRDIASMRIGTTDAIDTKRR